MHTKEERFRRRQGDSEFARLTKADYCIRCANDALLDERPFKKLPGHELIVHHIKPVIHGGSRYDGMVTLCRSCHEAVHTINGKLVWSDVSEKETYQLLHDASLVFHPTISVDFVKMKILNISILDYLIVQCIESATNSVMALRKIDNTYWTPLNEYLIASHLNVPTEQVLTSIAKLCRMFILERKNNNPYLIRVTSAWDEATEIWLEHMALEERVLNRLFGSFK